MNTTRRNFIKAVGATSALTLSAQAKGPVQETIRIGFIGVGNRGRGLLRGLLNIQGARIVAISDPLSINIGKAEKMCKDKGQQPKTYPNGNYDYRNMLEKEKLDAVLIATPWDWHAKMAVESMQAGNHALVEVPAAETVEECWQLVKTSEKTGKQCMMMENTCYGAEELMVLNMIKLGHFGEITHAEGAYIHEMRKKLLASKPEQGNGFWRSDKWAQRDANLYPTHGLGPIAQYMNINRGDKLDYLVSMSSNSVARTEYAKEKFPADHKWNKTKFVTGDMNTSIIKTALGKTIMLQYDVCTPRPYSRINLVQGTKGTFKGYPERIMLDEFKSHKWKDTENFHKEYDHPLIQKMGEIAKKEGGHGGMDFLMLWRIIYCLKNGMNLDQDVYDAASWSSIVHLTEQSVSQRSAPVTCPDFTEGKWEKRPAFELKNV